MTPKVSGEHIDIETLLHLSTLINSSLDIQTVMDNAMRCVEESLDAEASSIFEIDKTGKELFFRLARGKDADKVREVRLKIGEGVAGWVASTGESLMIVNPQQDPRFCSRVDVQSGFQTRSILCIPLKSKKRLIGVLQVLNKRSPEGFGENDLEMLMILGNQIATALENAYLYARLNQKFEMTAEELKITQEKLIHSERLAALGKVAQGIAHEIRNPVMIIGGFARRLQNRFSPEDPAQEKLKIILSEAERLQQMVSSIERYTSLRKAVFSFIHPVEIIEKVLSDHLSSLESRGIRIEVKCPEEIPEIQGDKELLELALENLLKNAEEAMPEGGVLEIGLLTEPERVILSVKDTGAGIETEALPYLFDPFFTSKTRGTGLGLTIVHRIVSDHNGEIGIDSVPGEGTSVRVCLPRSQGIQC